MIKWAGEITQQVRARVALPEDLGSISSTHMATHNCLSLHFQGICQIHRHTSRQNTNACKIKVNKSLEKCNTQFTSLLALVINNLETRQLHMKSPLAKEAVYVLGSQLDGITTNYFLTSCGHFPLPSEQGNSAY